MSVLLLQTGGADNLLLQNASNLLLQASGGGATEAARGLRTEVIYEPSRHLVCARD